MSTTISILRVVHIVNAMLMIWPFYALVMVNQRVKLGPPLGDRTDTYMENIVKNRTIPCFVFQATALISGLALITARGVSLSVLFSNPILGLKFALLFVVIGLLSYVHFSLQPRLDRLFSVEERPFPAEAARSIGALRVRRKQMASVCMFLVLIIAVFGVQSWVDLPIWLTAGYVLATALFTLRAYSSETPYGWV
jgi:hypothetical protein